MWPRDHPSIWERGWKQILSPQPDPWSWKGWGWACHLFEQALGELLPCSNLGTVSSALTGRGGLLGSLKNPVAWFSNKNPSIGIWSTARTPGIFTAPPPPPCGCSGASGAGNCPLGSLLRHPHAPLGVGGEAGRCVQLGRAARGLLPLEKVT